VILGIDKHHYWQHSQQFVGGFDLFMGVFKSVFFGAIIAMVSCYRGFHCSPGAEGVGRAATASFVYSFVLILAVDLMLNITLDAVYKSIWPNGTNLLGP
jgi:phospholipid/cholesterol/gamma-HCH transport system permease protein